VKQTESKIGTEQVIFIITALSVHRLKLSCTEPYCRGFFGQLTSSLYSLPLVREDILFGVKLTYLLPSFL
jgi:hypothetical protein